MFCRFPSWRAVALVAAGLCVTAAADAAPAFSNIYVLGDSLSDQGNLYAATGLPASPPYYQGRFSNGEAYSGLLASALGLPLTISSSGGNNFAYGGARTGYNTVEAPYTPGGYPPGFRPWSLNGERGAFEARGISDPNALYVVFSGSNDVADMIGPSFSGGIGSIAPQRAITVQGIIDVIDAFKDAGARFVLVPKVPDLGLVPRFAPNAVVAARATELAQLLNADLDTALNQIGGVQIIRFDTFGLLRDLHADPTLFGLTNVTTPCYSGFVAPPGPGDTVCSTPGDYAYWDTFHPSAALNSVLADRMFAALDAAIPEPPGVVLVLTSLAVLGFAARRARTAAG